MSGFEKTGIFPPNTRPAVNKILTQKHNRQQTLNPVYSLLLSDRFYQAPVSEKTGGNLSPPSRETLQQASLVATEVRALGKDVYSVFAQRTRRLIKLSSRRKRDCIDRPPKDIDAAVGLGLVREYDQNTNKSMRARQRKFSCEKTTELSKWRWSV